MVHHRRQLLVSVDKQCSTLLSRRKAKRVTFGLVVVDQRVLEEFHKRPIDVVTRERAPATAHRGRRRSDPAWVSRRDRRRVGNRRRNSRVRTPRDGSKCARRSFADLLCLGSGLWLDLSSRDDRGGDGNEPRALGLGVLGDPEAGFDELVALRLERGRGATNAVAGLKGSA